MNNKVFYQHPNLMRVLGMHETVMEVMVNVLGGDKSQVRLYLHSSLLVSRSAQQPGCIPTARDTDTETTHSTQTTKSSTMQRDTTQIVMRFTIGRVIPKPFSVISGRVPGND